VAVAPLLSLPDNPADLKNSPPDGFDDLLVRAAAAGVDGDGVEYPPGLAVARMHRAALRKVPAGANVSDFEPLLRQRSELGAVHGQTLRHSGSLRHPVTYFLVLPKQVPCGS